jgi:hypothetical protein
MNGCEFKYERRPVRACSFPINGDSGDYAWTHHLSYRVDRAASCRGGGGVYVTYAEIFNREHALNFATQLAELCEGGEGRRTVYRHRVTTELKKACI